MQHLSHLQISNKPLTEDDSQEVLTAAMCAGRPAPPGLKQAHRRHSTTPNYLKTKVIEWLTQHSAAGPANLSIDTPPHKMSNTY